MKENLRANEPGAQAEAAPGRYARRKPPAVWATWGVLRAGLCPIRPRRGSALFRDWI
jgi:hypothetical protein